MKRRDFLQLLAATGLTSQASLNLGAAQAAPVTPGHYLVVLNAGGGWDPTSLIDPKGTASVYPGKGHNGAVNSVELDNNRKHGQIQWSAVPTSIDNGNEAIINTQYDNFFAAYADRLTVINGIDNGTNNHNAGNRATWSGHLEEGSPSLAALYAATVSSSLPMSFISNGGYDYTASLVARARASSSNFINDIADPNYYNSDKGIHYRAADKSVNHYDLIKQAQAARIQRQQQDAKLNLRRQQLSQLFTVRGEDSNLAALKVSLDDIQTKYPTRNGSDSLVANWHANRSTNLKSQAQVVSAAFKANLAAGANLNIGGFDTHGNHDQSQYVALGNLLEGLHYLQACLEYFGIADKTTVVIGSDFGRTPFYNSGNGKDHWPVTSQMVLHSSNESTGGRVFGVSTSQYRAQKLNLQTGQADGTGTVMNATHVHSALRKKLGIDSHPFAQQFPASGEDFKIFG